MVIEQPVNTPAAWSERADTVPKPWLACGWSEQGQRDRLEAIVDELDPQPQEWLLDWGCGTGTLCELLPADVGYVGFDSAEGMIRRAIREHAGYGRRFQTYEPTYLVSLVACVGPFNLPDNWSKERTWHTLRHLWDKTGCRTLAVSLYAGDDEQCLIYSESECEQHARELSSGVFVERHRANDLLLVVRR